MNILIYTKDNCKYCERAKQLLQEEGLSYKEISLENQNHRTDFKIQYPKSKTVPQVFIDGELIGGYSELRRYLSKKEN